MYRRITVLICLIAAALALSSCRGEMRPVTRDAFMLDTVISITLYEKQARSQALIEACFEKVRRYELLFSRTDGDSDISRLNGAGGAAVTVDPETAALLQKAKDYGVLSGGAFDVTIAPVSSLWDFGAKVPALPDAGAVAAALAHVGWEKLIMENTAVRLEDPEAAVDLGGIAKGYIADALRDYLAGEGVSNALIDLGGNIYAMGINPLKGRVWTVGISDPFGSGGLAAEISAGDTAVVTSAVDQRSFTLDGTLYHHLLDPESGWPARSGLASVTIVCKDAADADALSTACFVMGPERGMALIESLAGTEALFISENGEQTASSGWGRLVASGGK